uniref:Oxysterol-binding protein n=1 Tax=Cyprinus carpio TaxID=7962 RepID=A0A8C1VNX5_CYPCA
KCEGAEFYTMLLNSLDSDESCEGTSEASFKDAVVYVGAQKNNGAVPQENGIKKHRSSLPAPMFSRNDFSVWSILKKCIGLELSKITMPIVFNEPLSFLQRISEYMEHTYLIQKACSQSDSIERMQTVAAFAVSAVASQWDRTGKPFNPLLGETYELTREDQGFRLISEQVSHHPPISAFHTESLAGDFVFHGSIYPKLKFWGKSVETLIDTFPEKVIFFFFYFFFYCFKCVLNFKPCGMFGKELHRVEGYIQDKSKKKCCVIYGKWTECMWSVDPQVYEAHRKLEKRGTTDTRKQKQEEPEAVNEDADEMPEVQETVAVIPGSTLLWRISSRPPHSAEPWRTATLVMKLLKPQTSPTAPPAVHTSYRLTFDFIDFLCADEASIEKERLEEKQRASRKERAKDGEDWSTRWFQLDTNPYTGSQDWLYTGGYFDRKYTDCPDIY